MIALPIIERELRVQARRPLTVWLRLLVGLVAGLVGLGMLMWEQAAGPRSPAGLQLLRNLGWGALMFSLLEGVRQTSDTLSQEKREGTIGLLFLTDLRGLDVVLGKLAAHALNLAYALMAAFPVLGLALGAGGVTAGEFWRLQLVLLDALFIAAACGLWVSARSHTDQQALLRALGLVAVLTIVPALACLVPAIQSWPSVSPGVLLVFSGDQAYQASPMRFWTSLLAVQGAAWGLLIGAGNTVQQRWHEAPAPPPPRPRPRDDEPGWPYRIPPSLHSRSHRGGRTMVGGSDPAVWLAWRRAPWRWLFWAALLVPAVGGRGMWLVWRWFGVPSGPPLVGLSFGIQILSVLVPTVLLALGASRRILDLRRSGALELLLSTPLSGASLARAEWQVLWHALRWPLAVLGVLSALPIVLVYAPGTWRPANAAAAFAAMHLVGLAKTLVTPVATLWLGLWFGLKARTAAGAVGRTVIWMVVVPWVATACSSLVHAWLLGMPQAGGPLWAQYALHLLISGLGIAYAIAWMLWARRQLSTRFRELASAI